MRIDICELQRTYTDSRGELVPALRGIDLQVLPGEFVAVSGPSGCGKSTLLNVIGLLDRPNGGACRLDGEDVSSWSEAQRAAFRNRRLGFVFQSFHLLPFLNVQANVELPLLYAHESTSGSAPDTAGVLGSVGLEGLASRYPSELSGGQQQRVAIARALLLGSDLLLADEPTGNLDPDSSKNILDLFSHLASRGRTILLVTHDPSVAARATRRVQMAQGRIVQDTATEHQGVPP
jgi:putative ABC transport system ATP-binding protein